MAASKPRGNTRSDVDLTQARSIYFGTGVYHPKARPDAYMAARGFERIGYDAMAKAGIAADQNIPLNRHPNRDLYLAKARAIGPTVC